jgi:chromosome segregation ATPase
MRAAWRSSARHRGGRNIGALVLRLKRYLVYRAHRALGIGPLFERTAHNEQHIVRAEEAFVRAQRRFESQAELAESGTRSLNVRIASVGERTEKLSADAAAEREALQGAVRALEARLAASEDGAGAGREEYIRAIRAVAAVNERLEERERQQNLSTAEVRAALDTVERVGDETRRQVGVLRSAIALQADRFASLDATIGDRIAGIENAVEGQMASVDDRIAVVENLIGDQVVSVGDRIAVVENMIADHVVSVGDRIAVVENMIADHVVSVADRIAATENMIGGRIASAESAVGDRVASAETLIGQTDRRIEQLRQMLTELREEIAAQATRRHNEDARLTQVEAVQVEVLSGLRQIQERWPGALDEMAQMEVRLTGFVDQMTKVHQLIERMEQQGPETAGEAGYLLREALSSTRQFGKQLAMFSDQISELNAKLEVVRQFVFFGDENRQVPRIKLADLD